MRQHRADIDGLRAVAVVPVVLFHAGVDWMGGGFAGVDVFFVISGYLITGIIAAEVDRDELSIARFYERRIRRIMPALLCVVLVTLLLAAKTLLPGDFAALGRSVMATALFGSNILFWNESGYFETESHAKPLLHTWSLSVEEQFYLVFPLAVMLLARWFGRRWTRVLLPAAAISFVASVWGVIEHPSGAFYLAPTRAWELLLGSMLAVGVVPQVSARGAREALAAAGLLLVLGSMVLLTPTTPFPGLAALGPCIGTACLLAAGEKGTTAVGRMLSQPPVVFLGLISYSLYLWHWPLLALGTRWTIRPLEAHETTLILVAATAAAVLSWRFVERPFRVRSSDAAARRRVLIGGGAATLAMLFFGALVVVSDGWPGRLPADVLRLEQGRLDHSGLRKECHAADERQITYAASCIVGSREGPASWVLWGDSHAMELAVAFGEVAEARGIRVRLVSYSGCAPMRTSRVRRQQGCLAHNAEVLAALLADRSARTIVLVARFSQHVRLEGERFLPEFSSIATQLAQSGRRVIVAHPLPEYPFDVPLMLARARLSDQSLETLGLTREEFDRQAAATDSALEAIQGVEHLRLAEGLCDATRCRLEVNGASLYFDDDHLSVTGARSLRPWIETLFAPPPVDR